MGLEDKMNNNNKSKLSLLHIIAPLTLSIFLSNQVSAAGLLKVYQLAAKKDPQLQQAFADFKSVEQNVPIAVADLLPEVTLNAGVSYDKVLDFTTGTTANPSINSKYFFINATQPLFYWDRIHRYLQSEIEVKKAIHDLEFAKEDLLIRVSEAYFNVLEAEDTLEFVSTEKKSVAQLYRESKERFDVGLIPIADVDEAQARLDLTTADEIQAKNDVQNRYDELIEIIGENINQANILTPNFKPSSPKPLDVQKWLKMAMERNHAYTSQKLNLDITRKNEDIAFAGHLPTLDANAQYRGVDSSRALQIDDVSSAKGYLNSYGGSIETNLEIFGGGGTQASYEQTQYNTKAEGYNTERVRRETVSNTKQAYRNVLTSIKQIEALEQAVKSGLSALEATKASYDVGTRASIDVLDRLTDLYQQKQRLSSARYAYIRNVLELKRLGGVLTNNDILTIDQWLITSKNRIKDSSDVKETVLQDVQDKDAKEFGKSQPDTDTKPTIEPVKGTYTEPVKTESKANEAPSEVDKKETSEKPVSESKIETQPETKVEVKAKDESKPKITVSAPESSQPIDTTIQSEPTEKRKSELRVRKPDQPKGDILRDLENKLLELEGKKLSDDPTDNSVKPKDDVKEEATSNTSVTEKPAAVEGKDPNPNDQDDKVLKKLENELMRIINQGNLGQ